MLESAYKGRLAVPQFTSLLGAMAAYDIEAP